MTERKTITLSDKDAQRWQADLERAEESFRRKQEAWKANTAAMAGKPLEQSPNGDFVAVNKDFPRVKQKIAQLFYQVPDVALKPKREEFRGASYRFQAVLNHLMTSEDRINVHPTVDEVLTDVLCGAGIGAVKVGYEAATIEVDVDVDPAMVPPELQATMLATGQVPTERVPKAIHEDYYVERISAAKLLIPEDFKGSNFDKADWLGFEFRLTLAEVKRRWGKKLPADFSGGSRDEHVLSPDHLTTSRTSGTESVKCREIWYWAARRDKDALHPKHLRRLVFVDGVDKPVVAEDSPFQDVLYDGGVSVSVTGMTRNPVRVLTLTYISDQAVPPSDVEISKPIVRELWKARTQTVKQRDKSLPMRWVDQSRVDDDVLAKLESGDIQDIIPVDGPGDEIIGEISRANYPRENLAFNDQAERDLDETWSLGAPQMGVETSGETTKAEVRAMQGGTAVRLDYERNKVMRWYVGIVRCVGDLVQKFADDEDYVEVVGPDGARELQAWDKVNVAGEFVYTVKPDTAQRLDAAQDRADAVKLYQMMANEPHVRRSKLVEAVIAKHGIDPTQTVVHELPPKAAPEPNLSFRFAGQDINPSMPNFGILIHILQAGGVTIPQELIEEAKARASAMDMVAAVVGPANGQERSAPAQTEHGGPAQQVAPLSKHSADGKTS